MEIKNDGFRVGFGTDLHRLAPNNRKLMIGGIEMKHSRGFGPISHSDGDAVLHAFIDALLGAVGREDIGTHFPDNDPKFRDADSSELLRHALRLAGDVSIVNVDITVHCEEPRIGKHRREIQENIAGVIGIEPSRISIKGKSFEQIPFPNGTEVIFVTVAMLCKIPDSACGL